MKIKVFVLAMILTLVLGGGWQAASAAPHPVIVMFESSLKSITVTDAEAGSKTTTLTWNTAGMTDDYRLTLHTYILDGWKPVFSADSVPLELNGTREVTVQPSLTFSPPTFLLSIVNVKTNSVIDQRIAAIPYDTAQATPPAIDTFTSNVSNIDGTQLAAGQTQVTVSWSVSNRVPTSNLVFEQVFQNGNALSVELPRPYLWIPSTAAGPLAPIYPAGESQVTLRLRVVDVVTNKEYASKTLQLPIVNVPAVIPATPVPVPTATPMPQPLPSSEIISFTANPTTVNPGAAVTLGWEVAGTGGITIQQTVPNTGGSQVVVTAQSPKGTAQVYLPDNAAYSVTYTLYPNSGTSSAQVQVLVYCPAAFFFGQGDGCPTTAPVDVPAVYQSFENGFAVAWQSTNEIDIFYSDGTASYFLQQDYAQYPDPVIAQAPPLERQSPGSVFLKVWGNAPDVQAKLGWALADPQTYQAHFQGVATTRDPRPEFVYYFTAPDGSVIGSGYNQWRKVSG